MMTTDQLYSEAFLLFESKFETIPKVVGQAPGRVNLIGEHTDYNQGYVFPFAIPYYTMVVGSIAYHGEVRIFSAAMGNDVISFKADSSLTPDEPTWANYLKGTIHQYLSDLPNEVSFNAVVVSNVPFSCGLSSSAALEVATASFLEQLYHLSIPKQIKVLRCQQAENIFAHTPCGIMDQLISTMAEKDHLLFLDCRDNVFQQIPFEYNEQNEDIPILLIANSSIHHNLASSEYPLRVQQCKEVVNIVQQHFSEVQSLRDITEEMLLSLQGALNPIVFRRAWHVIKENSRTIETKQALERKDYITIGKLMYASHNSLRDDYEVSCEECDFLVQATVNVPGVFGSRMTGGGFGGCTITLLKRSALFPLIRILEEGYLHRYHLRCDCYFALPSEGTKSFDINNDFFVHHKKLAINLSQTDAQL